MNRAVWEWIGTAAAGVSLWVALMWSGVLSHDVALWLGPALLFAGVAEWLVKRLRRRGRSRP